MTSKTSLFNKGMYKSTVKRFMWGSILYFVMLFVASIFMILMTVDTKDISYDMAHNDMIPLLYQQPFLLPSLAIAAVVPTVVALLVFRFVHSKRQSIFTHSLPVCRTANFVSGIAAAFTLMLAPLLLNTLILVVMAAAKYSAIFTVSSCFGWMGINAFCLFIMFSVAVFAAMLTGNSFAAVAINGLMHCFLIVIAAGFGQLAQIFLHGYAGSNPIYHFLADKNFLSVVFGMSTANLKGVSWGSIIFCIAASVVLYAGAYTLYRLRRMETVEDVAAFKCLNPIFKYLLTFLAAISVFAITCELLDKSPALVIFLTVIISVVVYFAAEMALKKTLRVWKAYKGYLAFAAAFGLTLCTFAFTSFFGFETRVPNISDISEAAMYIGNDAPLVKDKELIVFFADTHKKLSEEHNLINARFTSESYSSNEINVEYKLKNGKTLKRLYSIPWSEYIDIMDRAYANKEYKELADDFFTDKIDRLARVTIRTNSYTSDDGDIVTDITDINKFRELFEAVKSDIASLNYSEMYYTSESYNFMLNFQYTRKPSKKDKNTEEPRVAPITIAGEDFYELSRLINSNYKNTIKWLKDNGYGEIIDIPDGMTYYIEKIAEDNNQRRDESNRTVNSSYDFSSDKYSEIDAADVDALKNFAYNYVAQGSDDKPYCNVYIVRTNAETTTFDYALPLMGIYPEYLPDFLEKYVNK